MLSFFDAALHQLMNLMLISAGALFVSLLIDFIFGEPPAWLHPVVWMGTYLQWAGACCAPRADDEKKKSARALPLIAGALAWCFAATVLLILSLYAQRYLMTLAWYWALPLLALLLKPCWSWRMLAGEVAAVEAALQVSLEAGRARLAWLVSRDVQVLDEAGVRESAIETLAENLNDSVIAPLFWFVVAGLPGAVVYRFANTADAMWGYRGERGGRVWTWAGKWAARADDALSWPTARLTALLMYLVCASLERRSFLLALRREAAKTDSPNSGWPMAAMALLLNVRLSKPGAYVLHPEGERAQSRHLRSALDVAASAVLLWSGLLLCALVAVLTLTLIFYPQWTELV